ncbi:hypothetical protein CHARACLAT_031688 [Characodon lateralis]|uniref:Uncharacterized protein n=1 Tax=Characodon lateralis TaxID=208331 RepID=A0ABU7DEA6_9TELE|nr:hypothetical protein [Characodon lateralis]
MFLDCESWSTPRDPTPPWGEHANSMQKDPGPSCWKATVLPTVPPCSHCTDVYSPKLITFIFIALSDQMLFTDELMETVINMIIINQDISHYFIGRKSDAGSN